MKMIFILKMAVDLAMIIVLHCLSGYHLFVNRAHETLGILFFVLFLIHNGLNARQYRFLLRGRGAYPIVRTVVIALLWVCIAADAGSVDKHIFAVFVIHLGVDRIARCSGDIADYDALLTEDVIYKRGLTDVRLADNGDLYAVVFLFVFLLWWEILHALIQKIARSVAVDG